MLELVRSFVGCPASDVHILTLPKEILLVSIHSLALLIHEVAHTHILFRHMHSQTASSSLMRRLFHFYVPSPFGKSFLVLEILVNM